jgi:hypothetical protein
MYYQDVGLHSLRSGGVTSEFGGDISVVYHADEDRSQLESVLTAAVAWRRGQATHAGWRARLRRWQFRLGLDPLSRRFSIGRNGGLWYGSAGLNGEHATLFHPTRHVVRVLGRDYRLEPGRTTLVLLIDETNRKPTVRVIHIPAPRRPRTAAQLDPASGPVRREALRQEKDNWRTILRTHSEIAAFLTGRSAPA